MSTDLETRLQDAFEARAATTSTSPDAWARINRRVDRRDHRRSVALKTAAAAVIVVLVVGGGVALLRGGNDNATTVATGGAASKSADRRSAASPDPAAEGASGAGFTPVISFPAGTLSWRPDGDGVVVRFVAGDGRSAEVRSGAVGGVTWSGGAATSVPEAVFGVVPPQTARVRVTDANANAVTGGAGPLDAQAPSGGKYFLIVTDSPGPVAATVKVEALDSAGAVIASTS